MLIAWLAIVTPASGQETPAVNGVFTFGQSYPPDQWIPMRLTLRNPTANEIVGAVDVPVGGDHPAVLSNAVRVPPNSKVTIRTLGYFPVMDKDAKVLTTLAWTSRGERLARDDILGRAMGDGSAALPAKLIVVAAMRSFSESGKEGVDAMLVAERVGAGVPYPVMTAAVEAMELPRHPAGYDSALAVMLEDVNPDDLDAAQRATLLAYIRGGGTLILDAPTPATDPRGTWLAEYLPVKILGWRETSELAVDGQSPWALAFALPMVEAVAGDGTVALAGGGYVHAAYKTVGLGRVVFTSFPAGGSAKPKDPDDDRAARLWGSLLRANQPGGDWARSKLAESQPALLQRMIGKRAPAWKLAMAIVGGYLGLVLLAQLALGGSRRPMAFAAGVAVALIGSGGLIAWRWLASSGQSPMVASVATVDVSGAGAGRVRQAVAYIGADDKSMSLSANGDSTALRPMISGDAPTIVLPWFDVPGAGVMAGRVDRVWKATATAPRDLALDAAGHFGVNGLELSIDNRTGGALESPLLVAGRSAISLADLPAGGSRAVANTANPRGSYVNAAVFTSDDAKLRGDVVAAMLTAAGAAASAPSTADDGPMLIGWLANPASINAVKSSLDGPITEKRLAVVRAPVRIEPSAPGSVVRIPAAFVSLAKVSPFPLYDAGKDEWIPNRAGAQLLLEFHRPTATNGVALDGAELRLNIDAPRYTVTIRRGQASGGGAKANPAGGVVAEWSNPVGPQSPVAFDLSGDDTDAGGRVWLMLDVQPVDRAGAGEIPSPWQVREIALDLRGRAK